MRDLLNHFMTSKRNLVDAGELTERTWADYYATCARIKVAFGEARLVSDLRNDDFADMRKALAKRWGPVAIGNEIQRVRSVFKHGYDAALFDNPMRLGPASNVRARKCYVRHARPRVRACSRPGPTQGLQSGRRAAPGHDTPGRQLWLRERRLRHAAP